MTRYTVIGARGFVGSNVVAHLRRQAIDPFCPARDDPGLWNRDLGRIFYCAGLTGDYRTRPFEAVEAHVGLIGRIVQRAQFDRIIYLSSTRLYDSQAGGRGREGDPIAVDAANPEHLYELTKLLGENLVLHRSHGRGAVARLSYVFDCQPEATGFLADLLRDAAAARTIALDSAPDYARDYIHVDDVVRALHGILDGGDTGIINVARGETIDNARIAEVFARHGRQLRFKRDATGVRPVTIDASRLEAMGLGARAILPLIDGYLGGLS